MTSRKNEEMKKSKIDEILDVNKMKIRRNKKE